MTEPYLPPVVLEAMQRQQQRRRRLWRALVGFIVVPPLVLGPMFAGIFFYGRHQAARALEEAIAETDRLDPQWRLEDIEKRRAALPAAENAATPMLQAAALVPVGWPSKDLTQGELDALATSLPPYQLDPVLTESVRKSVLPHLPAATLASAALPLKHGFYRLNWKDDESYIALPHVDQTHRLRDLLLYLAMLQGQDGKLVEAWDTTLILLALSRSFGEEPIAITQSVRQRMGSLVVWQMEWCLAQGIVPDRLLEQGQQLLADEAAEPLLFYSMRGERAVIDRLFNNLENGSVDLRSTLRMVDNERDASLYDDVALFVKGFKDQHAWALRFCNKAVAASKLPPADRITTFQQLNESLSTAPPVPRRMLADFVVNSVQANVEWLARLSCTRAGLGVERFRLKHNRWPESLEEVVAANQLDKVPDDPYDGKPLRYRKTNDGVVVYSIGRNGNYAGDAFDIGREFDPRVTRYEFRLWDEEKRRQPFVPQANKDEKKDVRQLH